MSADAKPSEHGSAPLRCTHCGGAEFRMREYALHTTEDELLRQSWTADPLRAYICGNCGHVHWFA